MPVARDQLIESIRQLKPTLLARYHVRGLARPEWLIEIEAVAARV